MEINKFDFGNDDLNINDEVEFYSGQHFGTGKIVRKLSEQDFRILVSYWYDRGCIGKEYNFNIKSIKLIDNSNNFILKGK